MIWFSRALTLLLLFVLLPVTLCLAADNKPVVTSIFVERYERLPAPVDESARTPLLFKMQEPPDGQVFLGVVVTVKLSGPTGAGWQAAEYALMQGTKTLQPVGVLQDKGRYFPTGNLMFRRLSATASSPAAMSSIAKATIYYAVPKDAKDLVFKNGGHDTKLALPTALSTLDQRDYYDIKVKGARVVDRVQYKPKPNGDAVDYVNKDGKFVLVTMDLLPKVPDAGGGWSIHWCWCNVAWGPDKMGQCLGTYDDKKELLDNPNPDLGTRAIMFDNRMPTKPVTVVVCFPIAADAKDFSVTILGCDMAKGQVPG